MGLIWIGLGLSSALAIEPVMTQGSVDGDPGEGEETVLPEREDARWQIINGEEASAEDYPMTGGMLMDATVSFGGSGAYDMRMFVCSSTLIAPDVVILASHCVDPYAMTYGMGELDDVEIRWSRLADLSDHDGSTTSDWPSDSVVAWDWVMHPDWDMMSMQTGIAENNDVALLFLDEPVLDIEHAYLVSAEESDQVVEGVEVDVVGWGQQIATSMWESPPAGSYGYKMKGTSFIHELGDFEFQVGAEEDDVRKCHGDSGGPSFMHVDSDSIESLRLIGVTSHAYDTSDCDSKGGVDTRLDGYLEWIDAELVSRCEDGSRAWCDEVGIVAAPLPGLADGDTGGEDGVGGCACSSTRAVPATGLTWLLPLLGWLGWRRRPTD
jgi:hypothetical protein